MSDLDKVKCIAEHVGVQASTVSPLGRGATSSAWKVTHARDAFIIRFMPVGTQRPVTYQSDEPVALTQCGKQRRPLFRFRLR